MYIYLKWLRNVEIKCFNYWSRYATIRNHIYSQLAPELLPLVKQVTLLPDKNYIHELVAALLCFNVFPRLLSRVKRVTLLPVQNYIHELVSALIYFNVFPGLLLRVWRVTSLP